MLVSAYEFKSKGIAGRATAELTVSAWQQPIDLKRLKSFSRQLSSSLESKPVSDRKTSLPYVNFWSSDAGIGLSKLGKRSEIEVIPFSVGTALTSIRLKSGSLDIDGL